MNFSNKLIAQFISELKKSGWTEDDLKLVTGNKPVGRILRSLLRGDITRVDLGPEYLIDSDAPPPIFHVGTKVTSNQKGGLLQIFKDELPAFKLKEYKSDENKSFTELVSKWNNASFVGNATACLHYIMNPQLIPDDWKKEGMRICFPNTEYQLENGRSYMMGMEFKEGSFQTFPMYTDLGIEDCYIAHYDSSVSCVYDYELFEEN